MKSLKILLFSVLSFVFLAAECTREDDEFFNAVYTTIPNLVAVETQTNFQVNDFIWVNSNAFSRWVTEPNQSTLLDVLQTTNATEFNFLYTLERNDGSNNWVNVTPSNANFSIEKGSFSLGNYITAKPLYNPTNHLYEYRGGIRLTQTGQYRLRFFAGFDGTNFDLISKNTPGSTFLTIGTTATNASGGFYNFTVN
ncbi:hypothetical protein [Flavobacterium sp.]|uniref:hypothetical protein n=1 Tax=Flavobacterium sp. TaxID=239 RepID=UPI002FD8D3CA